MIGYDIFGNKSDVMIHSISNAVYRKIFFPEIAEKILLLENKPLLLKGLIYEICGGEHYSEKDLKSTLAHIAYFADSTFKQELEDYIDSNNRSTILRIIIEETSKEEDKKGDFNRFIDIGRLKKECRALLDTYKYLEA